MFEFTTNIRVRYAETDQMGYVYYGNYAMYYEVARVEALRSLGLRYKTLEETGIMMPVLEIKSKFLRPARYDDQLSIKLTIREMPTKRMIFHYEIFNEADKLINVGETTLAFVEMANGKPCHAPESITNVLNGFFDGTD
ncbi:MAG: acyl-CoA thioesterase [Cyclobacteriaceae bacterium]